MHVAKLMYYPVKSCKGIELQKAKLTESGIENDRCWIIVKDDPALEVKEMLTQRQEPKMVTITPSIIDKKLVLNAPGMHEIMVEPMTGDLVPIKVWDDFTQGFDQGQEVSDWLTSYLQQPVKLLAKDTSFKRPLPLKHTPSLSNFDYNPQVSFADGYPLLLLSTNSVQDFQSHQPSITYENFRPNI